MNVAIFLITWFLAGILAVIFLTISKYVSYDGKELIITGAILSTINLFIFINSLSLLNLFLYIFFIIATINEIYENKTISKRDSI